MVCKNSRWQKKFKRYKVIFQKNHDIHLVDNSTAILAVCNGGVANGLTQNDVLSTFQPFGNVNKLFMPTNATITIVQFDSVSAAEAAFSSPTELFWKGGGPAFLAFAEEMPLKTSDALLFNTPPGLIMIEDFITSEEELSLLNCLNKTSSNSTLKHRSVEHYGYNFDYKCNAAFTPTIPIPDEFAFLWPRLREKTGILFNPDQCTINKYQPGDGIPPHVDTHSAFTEYIVSVSLESTICMEWKKQGKGQVHSVQLPRRSICIMTEEARYDWTHCIPARKTDVIPSDNGGFIVQRRMERTSLTFRCRQQGDCCCKYPILCDSVSKKTIPKNSDITEELASELEKNFVHKVYNQITEHFSETRHKPWPNVVRFLESFSTGSIILDVGCGNGKYLNCLPSSVLIGCDRSDGLLGLCQNQGFSVFSCDCLQIPIRDKTMDGCICIAVIHHLSTKERRLQALREIARVLRPGGRALIYVWAKNQETGKVKSSYLKQRKKNKPINTNDFESTFTTADAITLPVHVNRTNFEHTDMFVPWQKKAQPGEESGSTFFRYYHVYEETELKDLANDLPGIECDDYYYDQGNWCIILRKNCS